MAALAQGHWRQKSYAELRGSGFVIDSLEALKDETLKDFGPVYDALKGQADLPIETVLPTDQVFTRGTQAYAAKGGRFAA